MKRSLWLLPVLLMLQHSFAVACAAAAAPSGSLPAPALISPVNQTRLHGFPRKITLEWSKVPGAIAYGLEIDYYYAGHWASQAGQRPFMAWVKDSMYPEEFIGNQPGSWRVWAIDEKRRPGQVSQWFTFTFGPDNSIIPPPPPDTAPDFSQLREPLGFDLKNGEACCSPSSYKRGPEFTMPKGIYTPEPEYTDAARNARVDGRVRLALKVGDDGLVKRVSIVNASRDDLGEQALKTVRTWRFEPAKENGVPIPYDLIVEVEFHLSRR